MTVFLSEVPELKRYDLLVRVLRRTCKGRSFLDNRDNPVRITNVFMIKRRGKLHVVFAVGLSHYHADGINPTMLIDDWMESVYRFYNIPSTYLNGHEDLHFIFSPDLGIVYV